MPSMPPTVITSANASGKSQIPRSPRCAAHRPTPNIAQMWSSPLKGWIMPSKNPVVEPSPTCTGQHPATPRTRPETKTPGKLVGWSTYASSSRKCGFFEYRLYAKPIPLATLPIITRSFAGWRDGDLSIGRIGWFSFNSLARCSG